MEVRCASNPKDVKNYDTKRLREEFLIQNLFVPGEIKMVYSHVDRIITGAACPTTSPILLEGSKELASDFFLQRRELGIINIGGNGKVTVDGEVYTLSRKDGLYIGMGAKNVTFESEDAKNPAKMYFNSAPAHKTYPTAKITPEEAESEHLGVPEKCNVRTIRRYIHPFGVKSCQLVMGMTTLEPNSVWNTMPCHTHDRRMEVYLYFDVPEDAVVFHLMGEGDETRHIVMRNEEAVISPSWSIHSGTSTHNYTFIWGMVGENQTFADQDFIDMKDLR